MIKESKNKLISEVILFFVISAVLITVTGCRKLPPPSSPYNGRTTAVFNPEKKYGIVVDVDGNVYKTIMIGQQTWMAENLRVIHYRNGDKIPNVTENTQWKYLRTGAYCNYNNTLDADTIATFGCLYNWYALHDSRGLAPEGWRVATAEDWNTLFAYLGGENITGYRLKEKGNLHWCLPNSADNSSGFTALPFGQRDKLNGGFNPKSNCYGVWWTSSDGNYTVAPFFYLFSWDMLIYKGYNYKYFGYSIRCIKE